MMTSRAFVVTVGTFSMIAALFSLIHTATARPPQLPIHASGSWQSDARTQGSWAADLAIRGDSVTGRIRMAGKNDLRLGEVSGSRSPRGIEFGMISSDGAQATFSATVTGTALFGVYETSTGDHGTWAGSWMSDAPQVGADWPAGVKLVPPRLVPETAPRLSGIALVEPRAAPPGEDGGRTTMQAPIVGANSLVNNPNDNGQAQNEPEIAVDRINNPNNVVAGANDYSFAGDSLPGYYFSSDQGVTWPTRGTIPGLETFTAGGDPVLDFDAGVGGTDARVFYAGIAFDRPPCQSENTIFVARSLDGGQTYQNAIQVAYAAAGTGVFHDKPWIATDKVAGSPYLNRVYVTWSRFSNSCAASRIRISVSADRGATFDAGRNVSDAGNPHGSSVAVGLDHNVHVVWQRGNRLEYDRCTNGGTFCGTDRRVANITPLPGSLPNVFFRVNSFPSLATDTSPNGSGYLYVVWADYRAGNSDVYFTRSVDSGTNWAAARPIVSLPEDEFFPSVSVDQNHFIRVVYYRRTDQTNDTFNTFEISSGDGGDTFTTPTQVNDGGNISPVQFGGEFIGDYIGIDTSTVRHPAWMDSRRGQQDIYTTMVSGC